MRAANIPFPSRGSIVALLLAMSCVVTGGPARATTLVRYEQLPALVEESRRALVAEIAEVRYGFDAARLHSTWLTLRVEEPLYGELPAPGGELTIKIYGAPAELADGTRLFVEGTPRFAEGDRYLLLLRQDSPWGFTGVAGLFQGAFAVEDDGTGGPRARVPVPKRTLFADAGAVRWLDDLALSAQQRGALLDGGAHVPLSLLRRAVLRLWSARGGRAWGDTAAPGGAR